MAQARDENAAAIAQNVRAWAHKYLNDVCGKLHARWVRVIRKDPES